MHANSGYVGWSMSRRAARAYAEGLAPISKIGSSAYIRAAAAFLGPEEWHHTSKKFNKTYFYRAAAVRAIAAQLKATSLSAEAAVAAIEAKREARRRASTATPSSVYAEARRWLIAAAEYEREAELIARRNADLAARRREHAADCRAAVRRIVAERGSAR